MWLAMGLKDWRSISGKENISSLRRLYSLYRMSYENIFPGLKQWEREAENSPSSTHEGNKVKSYLYLTN
jgi:hypothetical protein